MILGSQTRRHSLHCCFAKRISIAFSLLFSPLLFPLSPPFPYFEAEDEHYGRGSDLRGHVHYGAGWLLCPE